MGWASGSILLDAVWESVVEFIPPQKRLEVAKKVVKAFGDMDCDTINDCFKPEWPEIEQAYYELWPFLREDE